MNILKIFGYGIAIEKSFYIIGIYYKTKNFIK